MAGGIRVYTEQDTSLGKRATQLADSRAPLLERMKQYMARVGLNDERTKQRLQGQITTDSKLNGGPWAPSPTGDSTGEGVYRQTLGDAIKHASAMSKVSNAVDLNTGQKKIAFAKYGGALRRSVLDSGMSLARDASSVRQAGLIGDSMISGAMNEAAGSIAGGLLRGGQKYVQNNGGLKATWNQMFGGGGGSTPTTMPNEMFP